MDVFKEYIHIFLTTVLLISNFSTLAVAVCTLPTELRDSVWNYQYTDLSNNEQTTTLTFGKTTLTKPSNIRLNALGTILNAWTCISSLTLSSDVSVAVFKSDESYSDFNQNTKWVYICMKLTKLADNFFYFYLLSDEDGSVYPKERVYQSTSIPDFTVPVCSTFCHYTSQPRIRTLKRSGSSTTLPGDVSLCEPCDSSCEGATTETTPLKTTQNTRLPSISSEIDVMTNITSTETIQKTTTQLTSTEMVTTTETTTLETTQQTTVHSTSTEMVTTTEMTPLETTQQTTTQSTSTEMMTSTDMTPLETIQETSTQFTSTEMVTSTEMTPLETTQETSTQSTSTEMVTSTAMTPLKTTQETTTQSTSTEMVTMTDMTSLEKTQQTTTPPTSTEMVTTTEMTSLETSQQTTAQSTSTETDTTTEKKSTQKTTLPATSTNLVTPIQQTAIHIMVDVTEKDNDTCINEVDTEAKDTTTMDTQFTDTEKLMIYIWSIFLAVILILFGIFTFVYRKGHSGVLTKENTLEKGEEAYGISQQICYLYKGKDFGFQKIAIRHWDCH